MREQEKIFNAYRLIKIANRLSYYLKAENTNEAVKDIDIIIGLMNEYIDCLKKIKRLDDAKGLYRYIIYTYIDVCGKNAGEDNDGNA